eukprot:128917_1
MSADEPTKHISFVRRHSSDVSDMIIEEEKDNVTFLTDEEKASRSNSSIQYVDIGFNLLWEGVIFENVQSLRHFKDSKSFVDHVLKTGQLDLIQNHFTNNIVNYTPSTVKLASSRSFCNTKQRMALAALANSKVELIKTDHDESKQNDSYNELTKLASFPRITNMTDRYHSIMDEFMKSYFFNPGFELLAGQTPSDWNANPETDLFNKILLPKNDKDNNSKKLLYFANELNKLWKILYRECNKHVSDQPYKYSFIPLKHPYIFVPGGRFREIYYWDTFWIIQGLLCCGMIESSIKLVENLVDLVDRYGFVPNGTRKYYLTRSQPPLLTLMVNEIYNVTKDKKWLKSILKSLVKEYEYWTNQPIQVSIISKHDDNLKYNFSRYYSTNTTARPESYYEDRMTAFLESNEDKHGDIYRNIRAAAASGWDFSSRWYYDNNGAYGSKQIIPRQVSFNILDDTSNLLKLMDQTSIQLDHVLSDAATSINEEIFDEFAQERIQFTHEFSMIKLDTCNVIPVDLNIFLCKVEGYLSTFYAEIGNKEKADEFKLYQNSRINGILALLWDEEYNQFRDWNFKYKCFGNLNIASNFIPLWLECEHKEFNDKKELLVESLNKSNLICGGGIVTTLYETGEQWDYPNCWAPLNSIIIEGLYFMGQQNMALKIANIWINNNYNTFLISKKMHEKYHCDRYGTGGGGEYKPQFGFGWTNGVCLKLLKMFGTKIKLN